MPAVCFVLETPCCAHLDPDGELPHGMVLPMAEPAERRHPQQRAPLVSALPLAGFLFSEREPDLVMVDSSLALCPPPRLILISPPPRFERPLPRGEKHARAPGSPPAARRRRVPPISWSFPLGLACSPPLFFFALIDLSLPLLLYKRTQLSTACRRSPLAASRLEPARSCCPCHHGSRAEKFTRRAR